DFLHLANQTHYLDRGLVLACLWTFIWLLLLLAPPWHLPSSTPPWTLLDFLLLPFSCSMPSSRAPTLSPQLDLCSVLQGSAFLGGGEL
ncbi:hypothetical protein M9458_018067, partial [Cirrhinus mrigala]